MPVKAKKGRHKNNSRWPKEVQAAISIRIKNQIVIAPIIVVLINYVVFAAGSSNRVEIKSPDEQITVTISLGESSTGSINYSVIFHGQKIIVNSPLWLEFKGLPLLKDNLSITAAERRTIDETWQRVCGKSKNVRNFCNELRIKLEEKQPFSRRFEIIFRVYNDAVAFRYFLPRQKRMEQFKLSAEKSFFRFGGNHVIWAANYKRFFSSQESEFNQSLLSGLSADALYGLPVLIKVNDKVWCAVTEANLSDWAGMYLARAQDDPNALVTVLSPRFDEPGVAVKSQSTHYSPWRVLMLGDSPCVLIESDVIENLSEPCELTNTSWIKPGRCAWDWWWCGRYAPDAGFKLGPNNETMKYFIDFAAEMGWEYQLIDWYWYGSPFVNDAVPNFVPDHLADITQGNGDVNIPELVEYAGKKGVRLFVWLEWSHANSQMDKAFPLYEKWGLAGVKIDFMMRDDQEAINFYHRAVKKAAQHHLLVNFHGAYKPAGIRRTYPNLITREGVLGNEYNKWSARVTPDHCLTIPFTRMLAGPMDFTPGGFLNVGKGQFKFTSMDAPAPKVMGTRCFQLAMPVVYESPLQVFCDSPYNYRRSPAGLDFYKIVPPTWDETRVIHGQVGDFITIARRNGKEWFLGSMTDFTARSLEIPLYFLGEGQYTATIWADSDDTDLHPENISKEQYAVTAKDRIIAKMASAGGHVVHLKPVE